MVGTAEILVQNAVWLVNGVQEAQVSMSFLMPLLHKGAHLIASPAHTSTSDGLSPPSSPHTVHSKTFDDVDFPEAYFPVCYDSGDNDDDWHNDHDGDGDDDYDILSRHMSEDKNNEHVSICIIF